MCASAQVCEHPAGIMHCSKRFKISTYKVLKSKKKCFHYSALTLSSQIAYQRVISPEALRRQESVLWKPKSFAPGTILIANKAMMYRFWLKYTVAVPNQKGMEKRLSICKERNLPSRSSLVSLSPCGRISGHV